MKSLKNVDYMSWFLQEEPKTVNLIQAKFLNAETVVFDKFENQLGRCLTNYLLFDMEKGPWLAGNVVKKIYFYENINKSDWDIWCSSQIQYDEVCDKLKCLAECQQSTTSINATTFELKIDDKPHLIQVIKRKFYNSVDELLLSFDFTICRSEEHTSELQSH